MIRGMSKAPLFTFVTVCLASLFFQARENMTPRIDPSVRS